VSNTAGETVATDMNTRGVSTALLLLRERVEARLHGGDAVAWLEQATRVLAEADAVTSGYREFRPDPERLEALIRRAESLLGTAPD